MISVNDNDTSDGSALIEMNYIRFWQANGESQKTSMRVKTRLHQLVEEGVFTGGCAPFGYRLVKSGVVNKKGRELMMLEQNPEEVEIVKTIFEKTVMEGYGSYVMAEYINGKNILTHNGSKFQSNTIKRILTNSIYCGYYVRGGVTSKRIPELQIVDDRMFEQAQIVIEQRKTKNNERTQISQRSKSATMISGNIYCAHCGHSLCANSSVDTYRTKDGELHRGARKFRHMCSGKAMKRYSCDGQTVYSAERVDGYVIETLNKCFEKLKATPRDTAIENKFKSRLSHLRQEMKRMEKEIETLKRKLCELTAEIANSLMGDSKFTPDVLSLAIENTKGKIADNVTNMADMQNRFRDTEGEMKNIDVYYKEFMSWADEFNTASLERKKMIVCKLCKEITVGKGYNIQILLNSSYEQFIR